MRQGKLAGRISLIWIFFAPYMIGSSGAQPILRASWSFNDNSLDASGNGNDATLRGSAGYSENAAKGSHSLLLNGAPDYVLVGPIDFGDEFTICAWAFLEVGMTNIQTIIGNAMGGSTVDGFKLFINNWETSNRCILIETSDGVTRLDASSPENTFEEGFWNHVAVTMDRINGVARIYYNGEDVTQNGAIVPNLQVTQSVTIGSMAGPEWFWTGMIDDVRIYQGLLTADEINEIMNSPETGISQIQVENQDYRLSNYPNPFNPQTTISFTVLHSQLIVLEIVNSRGEQIRTMLDEKKAPGQHSILWDGMDESGRAVSSGVYFAKIYGDDFLQRHKMLLVR
ncbi:T9SS type A sorting domain-containing protein [candidate division KSB1 bacterium]|nr:T9SS type A sorting domain-containing protein [candidate division KSB1 bacterium]